MCIINVSFYRAYCLEHGEQQEQPIRAANQPNTPLPNQTGEDPDLDQKASPEQGAWTKKHPSNKELGPKTPERGAELMEDR